MCVRSQSVVDALGNYRRWEQEVCSSLSRLLLVLVLCQSLDCSLCVCTQSHYENEWDARMEEGISAMRAGDMQSFLRIDDGFDS